jgi:hypothetical protein
MSELLVSAETVQLPSINFNISRLVEVPPEVEAATQSAIATVWERHVGAPTSVNLVFANSIQLELPNGDSESVNSLYVKHTDTISIALGTLRERHPELPLETACVLHAGHEARHKVQTASGDVPPDSIQQIVDGTYTNSRHEVEAWQSSLEALIAAYPGQWFSFRVGQYSYSTR